MNPQYLYLNSICPCPKDCKCGNKNTRKQWYHTKCNTRSKINIRGDIFCDAGCEPYFIQNAKFECSKTEKCVHTQASFKSLANFLEALSSALDSTEFNIQSSHDYNEFARILMLEVGNRWKY